MARVNSERTDMEHQATEGIEFSNRESMMGCGGPSIRDAIQFGKSNRPHRLPAPEQKTKHRLARLGESSCDNGHKATLYHPWRNGIRDLDEFGIGIALYFRQLLCLAGSYGYTIQHNAIKVNTRNGEFSTPMLLRGSVLGTIREDLDLVHYGYEDLGVVVLLILCLFIAKKAQDVTAERIDESQQTPQDYSVRIMNPPTTVVDPETYYNHFKSFGEIVFVTVCLNNGILMKKVTEKHIIEHRLHSSSMGIDAMDDPRLSNVLQTSLPFWQRFLQKFGFFETRESLQRKLRQIKGDIHGLSQHQYVPVRVYITFNTEEAQRKCLRACNGDIFNEQPENMVAGQRVRVKEAEEPNTILWENLHVSKVMRAFRLVLALGFSALVLAASFYVIQWLFSRKTIFTAIFIASVNAALPSIMKVITWNVEIHTTVASLQASLMIKLVLARSINSAILLYIASPYEDIFIESTLSQIMFILLVDAFITPAFRALNIAERVKRKFFAPRQSTQAGMNRYFHGADWNMAERYTDMLKTMFMCMFYSAVLPTGLIPTIISMISTYWVDKYCLFRIWKKAPAFDATLAGHSRIYMVLIVWVHVMITRVFYANWPYESIKERSDCNFAYCKEPEVVTDGNNIWPSEQKLLVEIYSYLGLFLFVVVMVILGIHYLQSYTRYRILCGYSSGHDSGKGAAMPVPFRELSGVDCYIPLMRSDWLLEPVFGLDLTRLSVNAQQFVPVRNPGLHTAAELSMNTAENFPKLKTRERRLLFSKITYYPAEGEEIEEAEALDRFDDKYHTNNTPAAFKLQTFDEFSKVHNDLVDQNKDAVNKPPPVMNTFTNGIMIPVNGKMILANGETQIMSSSVQAELMKGQLPIAVKPSEPLPEGWTQRMTADGRTFFANELKQYTQWERPTVPATLVEPPKIPQDDTEVDWYIEGVHYETKIDPQGRIYYEDHVKRTTTWECPHGPIHI